MANGKRKMIGSNAKKFLEGASQNCRIDTNIWTQQNYMTYPDGKEHAWFMDRVWLETDKGLLQSPSE